MKRRILFIAALLALVACGGGGDGPPMPPAQPPPPAVEPPLAGSAPMLTGQLTGQYFSYGLERAGEAPISGGWSEPASCLGEGCAARDLRQRSGAGTRGGFETVIDTADGESFTRTNQGIAVTAGDFSFTRYGFWGAHGYAALDLGAGGLSADDGGTVWAGGFRTMLAWTGGEAAGSNPAGADSATWTGIAEAARTGTGAGTFERLQGTATVTIADLAVPSPTAGVDIRVPDHTINKPGWEDMPLTRGRFSAGARGTDWLSGAFHGPAHEEAWGVFDTDEYIGAFGAKKQ